MRLVNTCWLRDVRRAYINSLENTAMSFNNTIQQGLSAITDPLLILNYSIPVVKNGALADISPLSTYFNPIRSLCGTRCTRNTIQWDIELCKLCVVIFAVTRESIHKRRRRVRVRLVNLCLILFIKKAYFQFGTKIFHSQIFQNKITNLV